MTPSISSRRSPRAGFTLVEAIATIAVLATIAVVVSRMITEAASEFGSAALRARLHQSVAGALDRLSSELRQIDIDSTTATIKPSISAFTASGITCSVGGATRTVTYTSGTSTLSLTGSAVSNATLLSGCTSFTLAYYDKDNGVITPAGDATNVRRILITITGTMGGYTETLRTKVYIRSMMLGSGAP